MADSREKNRQRSANSRQVRSAGKSPKPNPARPSQGRPNSKKNLYRKSRYYRQRRKKQKQILLLLALIAALAVFVLVLRSCGSGKKAETAGSSAVKGKSEKEEGSIDIRTGEADSGQKPAENTPAPKEPVSLTVSVVGDCTLGTDSAFDYSTSLNAYFDSYGKDYFLQNVKSIFEADDLTIANFEGVLTESDEREDKLFAFKAPASFAGILTSGSVEAVTLANNHSHDYGEQGFSDTMAALDAEGVVHFGYDETAVMDVKGVKVGLVGIYELYDHMERAPQLKENIAKVKSEGAELVIVILHWGNEKETVPDSTQMALGRMAIDEGADLVCGHHPHVLQGIETYKGKNIVYSLGNFCFGGNSAPSDTDSMIFQQTFTITEEGVKADNNKKLIPCSISSSYGYNDYCPTPAEGDEYTRIMNKIEERSSWIDTP